MKKIICIEQSWLEHGYIIALRGSRIMDIVEVLDGKEKKELIETLDEIYTSFRTSIVCYDEDKLFIHNAFMESEKSYIIQTMNYKDVRKAKLLICDAKEYLIDFLINNNCGHLDKDLLKQLCEELFNLELSVKGMNVRFVKTDEKLENTLAKCFIYAVYMLEYKLA